MADQPRSAVPESAEEELARLRRLAIVDERLTTLVGVLDVREVLARVSEVAGRVLAHDAIALPVITEDRQHVIPFATAGPPAVAYPGSHPIPETGRYLLTDPWEFEIVDDLQSDPDRERYSASLGYSSILRVPSLRKIGPDKGVRPGKLLPRQPEYPASLLNERSSKDGHRMTAGAITSEPMRSLPADTDTSPCATAAPY